MSGQSTDGPKLTLYVKPYCPYCADVQRELDRLGLHAKQISLHQDATARPTLLNALGRATVPVLKITQADGQVKFLPESLDIIRYVRSLRPERQRPALFFLSVRRILPLLLVLAAAFLRNEVGFCLLLIAAWLAVSRRIQLPSRKA